MSTNDVPGAVAENRDALAMGCWAEHDDGSLILVESTEGERVVYSMFDTGTDPMTEYRDAMPLRDFEQRFSWDKDDASIKWTWHDKTPFPWDRVIKEGARDGIRYASAADQLTAASRVARSRRLRGGPIDPARYGHRVAKEEPKRSIVARLRRAFSAFRE